jgi:hypothetical protein
LLLLLLQMSQTRRTVWHRFDGHRPWEHISNEYAACNRGFPAQTDAPFPRPLSLSPGAEAV